MQIWLNFWCLFFWFSVASFAFNTTNFIKVLFFSELTWVTVYCYVLLIGTTNDDITIFSTSFFILGLAGLEFSIGLILVVIFKNINKSLLFFDQNKEWSNFTYKNTNKVYTNRYVWQRK